MRPSHQASNHIHRSLFSALLPRRPIAGCIFAEILGRKPLFKGGSTREQLEIIISKMGTPTHGEQAREACIVPALPAALCCRQGKGGVSQGLFARIFTLCSVVCVCVCVCVCLP